MSKKKNFLDLLLVQELEQWQCLSFPISGNDKNDKLYLFTNNSGLKRVFLTTKSIFIERKVPSIIVIPIDNLDLTYFRILSIKPLENIAFPNLEVLDLRHNFFSDISPLFTMYLPKIKKITLPREVLDKDVENVKKHFSCSYILAPKYEF